jgi:hypothetical protein
MKRDLLRCVRDENYINETTEQLPLKLAERAIAVTDMTLRRRL